MTRHRTLYVCRQCAHETPRWFGRCPACGSWNTLEEDLAAEPGGGGLAPGISGGGDPVPIGSVAVEDAVRFSTGIGELDRVLGGGAVTGSLILMGGDPGIGKSSLLLQASARVAAAGGRTLYASGEESSRQIRLRAERLGTLGNDLFVLSESNLDLVEKHALQLEPLLLVVDSIQAAYKPEVAGLPGSVTQVREGAVQLLRLAKTREITIFIVGHVTKEGALAGPRVLEHVVDTVLYLEGDPHSQLRVLRAVKNRFGSTNEIGLLEMRDEGLVDVPDASRMFLSERPLAAAGSVVVPTVEGSRPLLVEIQALVGTSSSMPPRRTADGIDGKRVQLLIAVLEKRAGLLLGARDVYVKVAGGINLEEPAVDLGLAVALASSFRDRPSQPQTLVFGEVGLAGEVRAVSRAGQRVREAEKMGFRRVILPEGNFKDVTANPSLELIGVKTIAEGLEAALEG